VLAELTGAGAKTAAKAEPGMTIMMMIRKTIIE
jgi:hypothetical protein